MRDPRIDPWPGDIVEKIGKRYVPVRRFVLRRAGMKVYYHAEGTQTELEAWLSTWMEWCGDARTSLIAPSKKRTEGNQRSYMRIKTSDYLIERIPYCWAFTDYREAKPEKTYHKTLSELLVYAVEKQIAEGGTSASDLSKMAERLDAAIVEISALAHRIEEGSFQRARPRPATRNIPNSK